MQLLMARDGVDETTLRELLGTVGAAHQSWQGTGKPARSSPPREPAAGCGEAAT
jgi:hypothetical protein